MTQESPREPGWFGSTWLPHTSYLTGSIRGYCAGAAVSDFSAVNKSFSSPTKKSALVKIWNLKGMPAFPNLWVLYFYKLSDPVAFSASSSPFYNAAPLCISEWKSPSGHFRDSSVDNGARINITCEGMRRERRDEWKTQRGGERSRKESVSHRRTLLRPNQKVSCPFSLTFPVWSPTPEHSQILLGVRLENWETIRGGKHHKSMEPGF